MHDDVDGGGGVVVAADVVYLLRPIVAAFQFTLIVFKVRINSMHVGWSSYEMAAVQPLVDSIHASFTLGLAAACVVAYESRPLKLEEEHHFLESVQQQLETQVIVAESWAAATGGGGAWGGAPRPWWWFDELTIVLITAARF